MVRIPYVVETSYLLSGRSANVELILRNETSELARDYEDINLGQRTTGDITFAISESKMEDMLTRSQRLTVHATINLVGEKIEKDYTYNWGAPFDNLAVNNPYTSGSRVYVPFSFDNNMNQNLDIRVMVEVFDSLNYQIGYGSDTFTALSEEHVSRTVATDVSGAPSYTRITVEDINSGLQYSMIKEVN